ncbi:MAG: DUF1269 domain-containing protein [Polyangiaceae bacterium]
MSELIAVAYDDMTKAETVRRKLLDLQRSHLVDLEDALVVVNDAQGKVKLNQLHNLTAAGATSGAFWGLLIGAIFSIPFFGPGAALFPFVTALMGAGGGALTGHLADIGVSDDFAKSCGEQLVPGTSALFVLVRKVTPDKVIEEIRPYGGTVLTTSLTRDAEAELQRALAPLQEKIERRVSTP